ncbi:hypothetical protein BJ508DRAFT_419943, partial [Ascobolus immersus RN42]
MGSIMEQEIDNVEKNSATALEELNKFLYTLALAREGTTEPDNAYDTYTASVQRYVDYMRQHVAEDDNSTAQMTKDDRRQYIQSVFKLLREYMEKVRQGILQYKVAYQDWRNAYWNYAVLADLSEDVHNDEQEYKDKLKERKMLADNMKDLLLEHEGALRGFAIKRDALLVEMKDLAKGGLEHV